MPRSIVRSVLMALMLSLLGTGAWAEERFVSVITDLPLAAGLQEVGEGVTFSTPQGRIAEASASGAVTADAVRAFYVRTLPQLGWRAAGPDRYVREDETLTLQFDTLNGELIVRFALAPTGQ